PRKILTKFIVSDNCKNRYIAKQKLTSTTQKTEDEWRRFAPPLVFCFYALSKTCFAISLVFWNREYIFDLG
ncbi:MAG: hypothetical protein ACK5C4_17140, partial [Pseudanabaena sp.]